MLAPRGEDSREYRQEQRFASEWAKDCIGLQCQKCLADFNEMRLRKSPMELRIMQHAIDISIEAHQRSWAAAANAKWEYEVDAEVAYTFKLRNADNWGYPDIVGCGPNATTLHYIESQGPVKSGDLLLMDVGAEYDHYTADITRTFPVNGKFSPEQAALYQIVYDAQEAVAKASRAGRDVVRREQGRNRSHQRRSFETRTDYRSQFQPASAVVHAWHFTLVGNECSRCWRRSEVCARCGLHQ